ncbi:MAG: TetR/AcrR family transcriptional regulator [Desulfobacteraceae bacterium]|nr:TetR/AcrR family transcriptional regulator [Desulfobacteraceae bacterium]MBC2757110.1 TetR/AcrR family transcriptional regulator [Desulfobacteraceae bacterium]
MESYFVKCLIPVGWVEARNPTCQSGLNPTYKKKKQHIIEAGTRLIVQKGIDKTSLADIADEAGISKGSLYYYYASKNELIFDIAEAHINQISENLFKIIEESKGNATWEELLKILFERILDADTRGRLHLYLVQQALNDNEDLKQRFRKNYKEWKSMITEGFAKLEPKIINHSILSSLIIAALDGFLIQSLLELDTITGDEFVSHLDVK